MKEWEPCVMMLHETPGQSLRRLIGTYIMIVAVIGTGAWLGSVVMQAVGSLLLLAAGVFHASMSKDRRMTPQQAADRLALRFGVRAR